MDEPCSALDPIATARIEELIDELRENYTIVIVTHSMQQAARVSQRTAFFHLGNLVEEGATDDDVHQPARRSARRTTSPAASADPGGWRSQQTQPPAAGRDGRMRQHLVPAASGKLNMLPAVDVEFGAVHVARLIGAEKVDRLGDFLRFAEAAQGYLLVDDAVGARRQDCGVDLAG